MNRIFKYSVLTIMCLLCVSIVTACGKDKKTAKEIVKTSPEVQVTTSSIYFDTDTLPELTAECEYAGRINWVEDQVVENGSKTYTWQFEPIDKDKFENVIGEISLIKVDDYVCNETVIGVDSRLEDGKTYVFENCVFIDAVNSSKKVDLTFEGCTFNAGNTGTGGNKCVYLTSITNLVINNCTFQGTTSAGSVSASGYALDLNIYSTIVKDIVITNNTFKASYNEEQPNVAISIKTRLGSTDNPADEEFWTNETEGLIDGKVLIEGNSFSATCNNIYLGTSSKQPSGADPITNSSTGAFNCEFNKNLNNINVYLRYTSPTSVTPEIIFSGDARTFNNKIINE